MNSKGELSTPTTERGWFDLSLLGAIAGLGLIFLISFFIDLIRMVASIFRLHKLEKWAQNALRLD